MHTEVCLGGGGLCTELCCGTAGWCWLVVRLLAWFELTECPSACACVFACLLACFARPSLRMHDARLPLFPTYGERAFDIGDTLARYAPPRF